MTTCIIMCKNEEKVIARAVNSIRKSVDNFFFVIDSGTRDNTTGVIESLKLNYMLQVRDFVDFATNRTQNIKLAKEFFPETDYFIVMDADEVWTDEHGNELDELAFFELVEKCYSLRYTGDFSYSYPVIFHKSLDVKYIGVTHEYPDVTHVEYPKVRIRHMHDGGSRHEKYDRDIRLLKAEIEKDPGNSRNYYYLAQSYSDIQAKKSAVETYRMYFQVAKWNDEIYYAACKMIDNYVSIDDISLGVKIAEETFPDRLEHKYRLLKLAVEGKFDIIDFRIPVFNGGYPTNQFVEKSVYDYLYNLWLGLYRYYNRKDELGARLSWMAIGLTKVSEDIKALVERNLTFVTDEIIVEPVKEVSTLSSFDIVLINMEGEAIYDNYVTMDFDDVNFNIAVFLTKCNSSGLSVAVIQNDDYQFLNEHSLAKNIYYYDWEAVQKMSCKSLIIVTRSGHITEPTRTVISRITASRVYRWCFAVPQETGIEFDGHIVPSHWMLNQFFKKEAIVHSVNPALYIIPVFRNIGVSFGRPPAKRPFFIHYHTNHSNLAETIKYFSDIVCQSRPYEVDLFIIGPHKYSKEFPQNHHKNAVYIGKTNLFEIIRLLYDPMCLGTLNVRVTPNLFDSVQKLGELISSSVCLNINENGDGANTENKIGFIVDNVQLVKRGISPKRVFLDLESTFYKFFDFIEVDAQITDDLKIQEEYVKLSTYRNNEVNEHSTDLRRDTEGGAGC